MRWLENPRPAPPPPSIHRTPSGRGNNPVVQNRSVVYIKAKKMMQDRATDQGLTVSTRSSSRRALYKPSGNQSFHTRQSNSSSKRSATQLSLCKQLATLLRILRNYIKQLLRLTGSKLPRPPPSQRAKSKPIPPPPVSLDPKTRKTECREVNSSGRKLDAHIDKPLPPMPRAFSHSGSIESLYSVPTCSVPPMPPPPPPLKSNLKARDEDASTQQQEINNYMNRAVVMQDSTHWVPPTVAGPSDPTREMRMWSDWKEKLERRNMEYDGMMAPRSGEWFMRWCEGGEGWISVGAEGN
ncbi:uncharacterized protein K460DRAFT_54860 [Cucurbitaria berberidis CBS 394.84]|uniref:Uncharacterized protein n=1 Tax=Cucurbitaria berberidis CBS 394.84 TaxID=1168544 RepID=A0A9P4GKU3_9PLEO|nr:uncharacterized protein K460DRAFT_54860 [Cucurbitaria berberidis CBS 394.84]KAF1847186.1 hypothetical protein K460DRAFT_54860 [Cucurbitaria berberidis CBS 394.84]